MNKNYFNSEEFLIIEQKFLQKHNLKKLHSKDGALIDYVPYSLKNNFCNQQLYSHPFLYLHNDAYQNFKEAIKIADSKEYLLRIWDCYRPFEVQSFMAQKFPKYVEKGFISHPSEGIATHVRGIAIDLTLVDKKTGLEIDMGTGFDNMNEKSYHHSTEIDSEIFKNRQILAKIMNKSGFETYENEWWHYNLKIFDYQNVKIVGAIATADKKYPKIPAGEFNELLSPDLSI
ncbi:MAG: M15 family metallopeptidase [Alphaproteobacteria bacterium]|nr:M15 family metallopeptidase [Alphaproteobacteria bacterium]